MCKSTPLGVIHFTSNKDIGTFPLFFCIGYDNDNNFTVLKNPSSNKQQQQKEKKDNSNIGEQLFMDIFERYILYIL